MYFFKKNTEKTLRFLTVNNYSNYLHLFLSLLFTCFNLDYKIESNIDKDYVVVWITFDYISISPNHVRVYLYYRNEDALFVSNSDNTFIFFDDFIGDSLDTDPWKTYTWAISVDNSWYLELIMSKEAKGIIWNETSFSFGASINIKAKSNTTDPHNLRFFTTRLVESGID